MEAGKQAELAVVATTVPSVVMKEADFESEVEVIELEDEEEQFHSVLDVSMIDEEREYVEGSKSTDTINLEERLDGSVGHRLTKDNEYLNSVDTLPDFNMTRSQVDLTGFVNKSIVEEDGDGKRVTSTTSTVNLNLNEPDVEKPVLSEIKSNGEIKLERANKPKKTGKRAAGSLKDDFFSLDFDEEEPMKKKRRKKKRTKTESGRIKTELSLSDDEELSETTPNKKIQAVKESSSPVIPTTKSIAARVGGSVTPPPMMNRDELTKQIIESNKLRDRLNVLQNEEDNDDDDLVKFKIATRQPTKSVSEEPSSSEQQERKRNYIVKIVSKLPLTENLSIDLGVKGTKKFSKILETTLTHFLENVKAIKDTGVRNYYDIDNVALIWTDSKMEIKAFFKPMTLNIKPPMIESETTTIKCLLIPKIHMNDRSDRYEELRGRKIELAPPTASEMIDDVRSEDELEVIYSDDEETNTKETESPAIEEIEGYFKIGLKGKDNKKIEVRVNSETKISSIAGYYIKEKGLDKNTRVDLIFDDEKMDLNQFVRDTELEEDFEIQVIEC